MSHSVAAAIHADGFHIGEHKQFDIATCSLSHHVDATDPRTGETWTVNAPTAYQAAFELAVQI